MNLFRVFKNYGEKNKKIKKVVYLRIYSLGLASDTFNSLPSTSLPLNS